VEFSSNLSAIYTKWTVVSTNFFADLFYFSQFFTAISRAIVAPSNNRNENYAVHLKELSLLKKNGVKLVEIGH